MPVIQCDVKEARKTLKSAGATITSGNTQHEQWRAVLDDATAVAYDEKIVIQGRKPHVIESLLRSNGGRVHLYFDGASRGNPGPAAVGWVLVSSDGVVDEGGNRIGVATNNQAEYEALVVGLEAARNYGFDEVQIRSDSELVVKQIRGEWEAHDPVLREHRVTVYELLDSFNDWSIYHVPRELNERADTLANEAFDEANG